MEITDWLRAACADADHRHLPELKPLLESLASSTSRLREADDAHRQDQREAREP